jgi:hypothetical protein
MDNCLRFLNYVAFLRLAADRAVSIIPCAVSRGCSCGLLWAASIFKSGSIRKSGSIAKAMQIQRIQRAWGHSLHVDSRGSFWIACETNLTRRPALAIGAASWTLTLSLTFSTRPRLKKAVLNGLFPDTPFPRLLAY